MRNKKKLLLIMIAILAVFSYQIYYAIPNSVVIQEGEDYLFPPMIKSVTKGETSTQLRLFGILPLRTVEVNIVEKTHLIPCGNAIGIRINVNGLMVVAMSDVRNADDGKKYMPARQAGLRAGDIIKKIDNQEVTKTLELSQLIAESGGKTLDFEVLRDKETLNINVTPIMSRDDNGYRIGAWIRDRTSGIGTITYINPKNNTFGSLGHGITDADTGDLIPAGSGDILLSDIVGVTKGERGSPGELRGVFSPTEVIGDIKINSDLGVYGTVTDFANHVQNEPIPIATRSQIRPGKAHILSNIESDTVEQYDVEIKNAVNNKGMIISITDERLLAKTGGIVQGMSGSPIIQDGKLIGAVTHVFINEPTRGYGTFIELMLNNTKND